jgi:lipopolysaccharide transport system permease protein
LVKINFPREAIFISGLYEMMFNVFISLIVGFLFILLFGIFPDWHLIFFIPAILLLILFGTGLGLLILPIGVLFKDVQYGMPSILQFLMYLSPVVYAQPFFGGLTSFLQYNPVSPLINWARASITGGEYVPPAQVILIISGIILFCLIFGLILQRIAMKIMIERMGS